MAKDKEQEKTKEELEAELEEVKKKIEEEKETETKETKEVPEIEPKETPTIVVSELPTVQTRVGYIGDQEVKLITPDEAMTEMYNSIKAMRIAIG